MTLKEIKPVLSITNLVDRQRMAGLDEETIREWGLADADAQAEDKIQFTAEGQPIDAERPLTNA